MTNKSGAMGEPLIQLIDADKLIFAVRSPSQDFSTYFTTHVEHVCNDPLQRHGDSKKGVQLEAKNQRNRFVSEVVDVCFLKRRHEATCRK
jgi:hypothetical protein